MCIVICWKWKIISKKKNQQYKAKPQQVLASLTFSCYVFFGLSGAPCYYKDTADTSLS